MLSRSTPGSEAIGSATSSPSRTKIGQIRSAARQPALGDHRADPGRAAQPARPAEREGGGERRHAATSSGWLAPPVPRAAPAPQARSGARRGCANRPIGYRRAARGPAARGDARVRPVPFRQLLQRLVLGADGAGLDAGVPAHARRAARHGAARRRPPPRWRRGWTRWRASAPNGWPGSATRSARRWRPRRGSGSRRSRCIGFRHGVEAAKARVPAAVPARRGRGRARCGWRATSAARGLTGAPLRRMLARRRTANQIIAILAILAAAASALGRPGVGY